MKVKKLVQHLRHGSLSRSGFTLIEVLVTMTILAVGLLGTAVLTGGIIKGNNYSKNVTSATAIARTRLEEVQRNGYALATAGKATATVAMNNFTFNRTTTITNNSPAANMTTVAVTVTWQEANNVSRMVTLTTILAM